MPNTWSQRSSILTQSPLLQVKAPSLQEEIFSLTSVNLPSLHFRESLTIFQEFFPMAYVMSGADDVAVVVFSIVWIVH